MKHMFQGLIDETMEKGERKGSENERLRAVSAMKNEKFSFDMAKKIYSTLTQSEWDAIAVCENTPEYKE